MTIRDVFMKKTLFALVLSFTVLASSCADPAVDTDTDYVTETTSADTGAQTLAELITEAVIEKETAIDTSKEEQTTEISSEETVTEEITEKGVTAEEETETEAETEEQKENTVYAMYKNAAEKTNALTCACEKTLTVQDINAVMPDGTQINSSSAVSSDIRFSGLGSDAFRCEGIESHTEKSGGTENVNEYEFFSDKGIIYLKDQNTGVFKAADDNAPAFSSVKALLSKENLYISVLSEDIFASSELTENGDGSKTIKALPSDKDVNNVFKDIDGQLDMVFGILETENVKYNIKNAEFIFIISSEGYIIRSEVKMDIEIEFTSAGASVKATASSSTVCELTDPGRSAEIDLPVIE